MYSDGLLEQKNRALVGPRLDVTELLSVSQDYDNLALFVCLPRFSLYKHKTLAEATGNKEDIHEFSID